MGKINFKTVEDKNTDFAPIPEERYKLECVDASLGISNAGNSKIDAQFKIIDDDEFNNRRIFANFSLLPNALFNLKNYFEAAGLDTEGEMEEKDIPDKMIGTVATAYLENDPYENKAGEKKQNSKPKNWKSVESQGKSLFS